MVVELTVATDGPDALPPFARGLALTRSAIAFAARRHADQQRESDASPFLLHPLEVASLLYGRGYADDVVAAGALHDVLEKTDATVEQLRGTFGERVARLVAAVSEDTTIDDYLARKASLRDQVATADPDAQALYAADKVAKVRELRAIVAHPHRSLDDPLLARRLEHYRESHRMLEAVGARSPLTDQLGFELWALRRLPPG